MSACHRAVHDHAKWHPPRIDACGQRGTVARMDTTLSPHRPEESAAYCLIRDETVASLINTHPVTAALLVERGLFPTRKKARERLRVLTRQKRIHRVGVIWRKAGSPENVYCLWRPKSDQLPHEVELSALCLRLSATTVRRGPGVKDRTVRPDAEVQINDDLFYLELDRGSMRIDQIEERLAKYRGCPHMALWVCPNQKRLEAVRRAANAVVRDALFTTFDEALADPHAEIWQDFNGERTFLPCEQSADASTAEPPRPEKEAGTPAA